MNATSCDLKVLRQETVAADIMRLTVQWQDPSREPHAGQFYMLRAWAADATPILSRPISVDDFDNQTGALTFLYQVKGEGTRKLAALAAGDTLTVTGPCGNGFDTAALASAHKRIAVVGGGIGTAPLLLLCKELCRAGVRPDLYVGFRDASYGMESFVPWCHSIHLATDSGSEGHHGLVTDLLDVTHYDIVLTCGPMVMMRGVAKLCAAGVDFIELNISCPNVKQGGLAFGIRAQDASEVVSAVRKVCTVPLVVKLSPQAESIPEMCKAVEAAGADAISLCNTFQACAIDLEKRRPVFNNTFAGLSGPAVRPIALRMVWQAVGAVSIPVMGLGGILTGRDALEFIMAGATAVQVGTANFLDPKACTRITNEIGQWMDAHGVKTLDEIRGCAR